MLWIVAALEQANYQSLRYYLTINCNNERQEWGRAAVSQTSDMKPKYQKSVMLGKLRQMQLT